MLEYETVRVELVQLSPPAGEALACFEENARHFLFPEPKLVPSFSGVDQEVLMTRAPHFPGIAPRLEFSTKTTIIECSVDAETNHHPNIPMRPVVKRPRKRSSRPRTSSPRRKRSQTLERRRDGGMARDQRNTAKSAAEALRSRSLSPLRAGNNQHLTRFSLDSNTADRAKWDTVATSHPATATKTAPAFLNSLIPLTMLLMKDVWYDHRMAESH
ncbi:spermatogenesis-associated protein 6-like [Myripristis murdjan]|uniref:spermatogenesis-associated protein 6-like n=1 Tax=Myripristis murdjan TaxID=586833 RepID=UPI00117609F7|nr:spermatogenesis-associated protein 6-like [Myripristis murdjan]